MFLSSELQDKAIFWINGGLLFIEMLDTDFKDIFLLKI